MHLELELDLKTKSKELSGFRLNLDLRFLNMDMDLDSYSDMKLIRSYNFHVKALKKSFITGLGFGRDYE